MKKVSTTAAKQRKNFREHKLTIGLDLGDRSSWYCVLDEAGSVHGSAHARLHMFRSSRSG
jgi:Ethanolamine utilization protein EutJ (predicted chaperonin)